MKRANLVKGFVFFVDLCNFEFEKDATIDKKFRVAYYFICETERRHLYIGNRKLL